MSSSVNVFVVSPDTRSERRYDLSTTVLNLKNKLELITGIPAPNQRLLLLNNENDTEPANIIDDDTKVLGYYSVRDWQFIKVVDTNPSVSFTGQLTDVSAVDKFELTEEEYAQRTDTVLAYKQRNKIGRFADKTEEEPTHTPEVNIPLGSRCEVESTEEDLHKRGVVRFVGPTKFGGGGVWVGIEFDEPMGKNDGSVQGERYFECKPNFGIFARPQRVKIGDYPPVEINFDDDEEM